MGMGTTSAWSGVVLKARTVWLCREVIQLGNVPGREARLNGRRIMKWALRPKAGFMNESVYPHEKPPMWVTIVGVVGCFEWLKKKKSKCSCNVTSVVCVCRLTEYFGRWLGAKRLLLQVIIIPVSLTEPNQQLSSEDDNYSSCVCLSLLSIGLRKCTLLYFFLCVVGVVVAVTQHCASGCLCTVTRGETWMSGRLQPVL